MTGLNPSTQPGSRPKVVVTGGAGFIGGHLAERLVANGADVLVVDDLSTGSLSNVPPEARLEPADIALDDLAGRFAAWRPTTVYHLAAQASVSRSMGDPLRDVAVNVVGTHRVAAAARQAGALRIVFVSSGGAVYGATAGPATEATLPDPISYYGVHKLAAEGHVRLARMSNAIIRPSNVYGSRQAAGLEGAVVAAFLADARSSGTLTIHGDGLQTRDFIHVDDVVNALVHLGDPAGPVGTWNVATGASITIRELADTIERAVGQSLERVSVPARAGDVRHSALSADALVAIGWRPSMDLESGIRRLVQEGGSGAPEPAAWPRC